MATTARRKSHCGDLATPEQIKALVGLCKNILHGKENALGNLTAMITGIPNVGKSTIINILAGKMIAKTGNEPAITKGQQCINLHNGLLLYDTPGILWPKIENVQSGYRLVPQEQSKKPR